MFPVPSRAVHSVSAIPIRSASNPEARLRRTTLLASSKPDANDQTTIATAVLNTSSTRI